MKSITDHLSQTTSDTENVKNVHIHRQPQPDSYYYRQIIASYNAIIGTHARTGVHPPPPPHTHGHMHTYISIPTHTHTHTHTQEPYTPLADL